MLSASFSASFFIDAPGPHWEATKRLAAERARAWWCANMLECSYSITEAPVKRKRGEVREDGRIFKGYQRTPAGTRVEQWLSPEAWQHMLEWRAAWEKRYMLKKRGDPVWLAEFNAKQAARMKSERRINPIPHMLARVRTRAKAKGIVFNLEAEDIVVPRKCPVLNKPLSVGEGKAHDWSPEIDRIVPSKGYIKGNIIVVSRRANRIKTDATPEDIQKVAAFYLALKARAKA